MEDKEYYAAWLMTDKCNFHCDYCPDHSTFYPITNPLPIKKMIKTLKATGKKWTIGLSGGEPFLYPNFVKICEELTKNYQIALDTNLSINSQAKKFAEHIDPKKVLYVYVSLHISEREKRGEVEDFIKNVLLLEKKGFKVMVNYVLHPTLFNRFERDYQSFKSKGIGLEPKPFRGEYEGIKYPEDYSKSVMKTILKYNPEASNQMPFSPKGIKCNAGKTFIQIQSDGSVVRCLANQADLGSIFSGIRLNKKAEPCKIDRCPCHGHKLIEK